MLYTAVYGACCTLLVSALLVVASRSPPVAAGECKGSARLLGYTTPRCRCCGTQECNAYTADSPTQPNQRGSRLSSREASRCCTVHGVCCMLWRLLHVAPVAVPRGRVSAGGKKQPQHLEVMAARREVRRRVPRAYNGQHGAWPTDDVAAPCGGALTGVSTQAT